MILDGNDTCAVVGLLQQEGQAIELDYELYTPMEQDPEAVYLECMALVIRAQVAADGG